MARIQFVNIDDPLRSASAKKQERQAAYAHAARAGHTKRKRRQQKPTTNAPDSAPCQDDSSVSNSTGSQSGGSVSPQTEAVSDVAPTLPVPVHTRAASQNGAIPDGQTALIHSWRNSSLGSLDLVKDRDPFKCFARGFSPIELYLLEYYTTDLIPQLDKTCRRLRNISPCPDVQFRRWMALALGNGSLLNGVLMTASRHLSMLSAVLGSDRAGAFGQLATEYKLRCVRELQNIISDPKSHDAHSDNTVASVLNLTLDELFQGNMEMAVNHMRGASILVNLRGGPQALGVDGFLEVIYFKFAGESGFSVGPRERPVEIA